MPKIIDNELFFDYKFKNKEIMSKTWMPAFFVKKMQIVGIEEVDSQSLNVES